MRLLAAMSIWGRIMNRPPYKELDEETGLQATPDQLVYLGMIRRKSSDPSTNTINNAVKKEFAYRYDGDPKSLRLEKGKATSLEFWSYSKITRPSDLEKKQFLPLVFEAEMTEYFKKIQLLARQITSLT